MRPGIALTGGIAGASVLTTIHEIVRKTLPLAPRMDLLGMMALSKILSSFGKMPPSRRKLFFITMAGDIASNAFFYALSGVGKKKYTLGKGLFLGLSAGIGAVLLPKPLGLDPAYSRRTTQTALMTIAWYTIGGLVSALVMKAIDSKRRKINLRRS
jgi:hypothetical protein